MLLKEQFAKDVIGNLFDSNLYLRGATNHAEYLSGKYVNVPRAGSTPTVVKNRSSYPATATQRTDTDVSYEVADFTTDPTHLLHRDELELNYDKRMSIFGEHIETLSEKVGDYIIHTWVEGSSVNVLRGVNAPAVQQLPAANIIATTGTVVSSRRKLVYADLLAVQKRMNLLKIPRMGRFMVIEPTMYSDLLDIPEFKSIDYTNKQVVNDGLVGSILGFSVYERTLNPIYASVAATPAPTDLAVLYAAPTANDRTTAIFAQQRSVSQAVGEANIFIAEPSTGYYGGTVECKLHAGGARLRNEGVVVLVQGV